MSTIRDALDAALITAVENAVKDGAESVSKALRDKLTEPDVLAEIAKQMNANKGVAEELARQTAGHACDGCVTFGEWCLGERAPEWLMQANRSKLITLSSVLLILHGRTLIERAAARIAGHTGNGTEATP